MRRLLGLGRVESSGSPFRARGLLDIHEGRIVEGSCWDETECVLHTLVEYPVELLLRFQLQLQHLVETGVAVAAVAAVVSVVSVVIADRQLIRPNGKFALSICRGVSELLSAWTGRSRAFLQRSVFAVSGTDCWGRGSGCGTSGREYRCRWVSPLARNWRGSRRVS